MSDQVVGGSAQAAYLAAQGFDEPADVAQAIREAGAMESKMGLLSAACRARLARQREARESAQRLFGEWPTS